MARLTGAQRAMIRKKSTQHELDPSEMVGELNIVPFLDIVVNIIMFLLVTTAAVIAVSQLDSALPQSKRSIGGSRAEAGLNLSINITEGGIVLAASGGKFAPGCESAASGRVITVARGQLPELAGGTSGDAIAGKTVSRLDWAALRGCLEKIKAKFPDETQAIISADPLIQYEDVVGAMEVARGKSGDLFPSQLLSAGVK